MSIELSLLTAIVPGILGLIVAYAVLTSKGRALRRIVSTASGVFAQFGGVPLAFLFIATLGTTGLVTNWMKALGFDPWSHGFDLYTFFGVAIVYTYFQLPLMVLVITPALEGLRPAWREAASGMGARGWQYWRYVGGPVLFPSFLGGVLLLFGSGLSAYATAEALTSGSIPLTSIQIGSFLNGNVICRPAERRQGPRARAGRDHRRGDGVLQPVAKKGVPLVAIGEVDALFDTQEAVASSPRPWTAGLRRHRLVAWDRPAVHGCLLPHPALRRPALLARGRQRRLHVLGLHGHTEPGRVHRRAQPLAAPGRGHHLHHPRS